MIYLCTNKIESNNIKKCLLNTKLSQLIKRRITSFNNAKEQKNIISPQMFENPFFRRNVRAEYLRRLLNGLALMLLLDTIKEGIAEYGPLLMDGCPALTHNVHEKSCGLVRKYC